MFAGLCSPSSNTGAAPQRGQKNRQGVPDDPDRPWVGFFRFEKAVDFSKTELHPAGTPPHTSTWLPSLFHSQRCNRSGAENEAPSTGRPVPPTSGPRSEVKSLLVQNNLPTDLQLHCYMRELVKAQTAQTERWTRKCLQVALDPQAELK